MKMIKGLWAGAVLIGLQGCFWDDAKDKINETKEEVNKIKQSINSEIASAKRTADGLIADPALRDSAMQLLKEIIPDSLAIASNLATSADNYQAKLAKIQQTFAVSQVKDTTLAALANCLAALPTYKMVENPTCYGPKLSYDPSKLGAAGPQPQPNQMQSNELPPLDLGLWSEKEGSEACAAAKMNQLTTNSSYYADLAVGSMAMMVCAAAFQGDTIPGDGKVLNLTNRLNQIKQTGTKIDSALISHKGDTYYITLKGQLQGDTVSIQTKHTPSTGSGVIGVLSKVGQKASPNPGGAMTLPMHSVSVKYVQKSGTVSYRLASAQYGSSAPAPMNAPNPSTPQPIAPDYVKQWQNSLDPTSLELNILPSTWTNDLNLIQASFSATEAKVAYGWQAGSGDGFLRVFNAETKGTTGKAWFGYSPSCSNNTNMNVKGLSACSTSPISINSLDKLLTIDRMICNWAGPGNDHNGQKLLQNQSMEFDGKNWVPTKSYIRYAPTNTCTVSDPLAFPTLGKVDPHELLTLDGTNYSFTVPLLP